MTNFRLHKNNKTKKVLIVAAILAILSLGIYAFYFNGNSIDKIIVSDKEKKEDIEFSFDGYIDEPSTNYYDLYYTRPAIKGVFVNAPAAGSTSRLNNLIQLANETEINAFVIDVKEDDGRITFDMDVELADEIGAEWRYIRDINALMDQLYDNNIYPIARIVAFKDPYLSKNKTEYAIKNQDGSLWKYKNISWLNPYNQDTWKYIVQVAKKAAEVGFKEIQFDYIRFEATSKLKNADFGETNDKTRREIILEFLDYANSELKDYNIEISADVFGIIINSEIDSKTIGQNYIEMAKKLDVISPMVYPSHYGFGFFGIPSNKHSDLYPYEVIYGSMEDSNEQYELLKEGEKGAIVRPWLQAFTASYLRNGNYKVYGGEEIRAQIQAVYDAGLSEWILWHAGSKYSGEGLLPE